MLLNCTCNHINTPQKPQHCIIGNCHLVVSRYYYGTFKQVTTIPYDYREYEKYLIHFLHLLMDHNKYILLNTIK